MNQRLNDAGVVLALLFACATCVLLISGCGSVALVTIAVTYGLGVL